MRNIFIITGNKVATVRCSHNYEKNNVAVMRYNHTAIYKISFSHFIYKDIKVQLKKNDDYEKYI